MLTPDDVLDIVRVLDSASADELHVETADLSITLRRGGSAGVWTAETTVRRPARHLHTEPAAAVAPEAETSQDEPQLETGEGLHAVRAPLLGTFYRAPKPGAAPFVDVGSRVEPDTVVGIVETMKMMNSVHAGMAGTVARICLADAQFADSGAVLMLVEAQP